MAVNDTSKLIASMDKLTKRVDKLVTLFEDASKHVSEVESTEEKVRNLSTKLEELLEQNKTIAKGLIILDKYVRGQTGESTAPKNLSDYGNGL
jgi:hypothetical protein